MTAFVVRRKYISWQDRLRSYRVLVDGKEVAEVANGSEIRVDTNPGKHVVQMKIDWCRSKELEVSIEAGETQVLECGPNATPLLALVYITVLRKEYLWLRREAAASLTRHSRGQ